VAPAELLRRYYASLDGRPLDRAAEWVEDLAEFFAEGATIRVVNGRPGDWRAAFVHEGARLPQIVATTRHEVLTVIEDGEDRVACELAVTYEMKNGGVVTLPGSVFAVVRDGRFTEQHMYVDFAPVFRAARKGD
jgi:ketosteroid isomerase-like protein